MNNTLTAALAGEHIAALHRDASHRKLTSEARAARKASHVYRSSLLTTSLLPTRWRQAAA